MASNSRQLPAPSPPERRPSNWDIFRLMLDVASGRKKTWAETWGISNALALFNPGPVT
jgi:altronate dehydratase